MEFTTDDVAAALALGLPGVSDRAVAGHRVQLRTSNVDDTLATLYRSGVPLQNVSVTSSDLDEVFVSLTHPDEEV